VVATKQTSGGTPLWIRIWHWAVAALFLVLVFTGVVLSFSKSEFALMNYELATSLHDWTGISLTSLYALFLVAAFATGYWRVYLRRCHGQLRRIRIQFARVMRWNAAGPSHEARVRSRLDVMQPLLLSIQQFLYLVSVSALLPVLIVTGLFYLYPHTAPDEVMGFAGLWAMAQAHYLAGLLGTLFLLFHIYISTIGGLRRMIFGR